MGKATILPTPRRPRGADSQLVAIYVKH